MQELSRIFSTPLTGRSSSCAPSAADGAAASATTSPFVININWDPSVGSAPSGFTTAVNKVVQFLESQFSNPATITIDVGYGEVGGSALGSFVLGESSTQLNSVRYSTLVNALSSHATTAADRSAVATLPSSSPVSGTFRVSTADETALGLPSGSSVDGAVGFSSSYAFTYDDSNGVAAGTFDFYSVALHEITEVMGRKLLDGGSIGSTSNSYTPLDLYHYSSAGVRDFSSSVPGYLSIDGENTNNGNLNIAPGGDPGDWSSSMGNDAFDAFIKTGEVNNFSKDDLTAMSLLGWEPTVSVRACCPVAVEDEALRYSRRLQGGRLQGDGVNTSQSAALYSNGSRTFSVNDTSARPGSSMTITSAGTSGSGERASFIGGTQDAAILSDIPQVTPAIGRDRMFESFIDSGDSIDFRPTLNATASDGTLINTTSASGNMSAAMDQHDTGALPFGDLFNHPT
jgi:hypothetical protein